MGQSSSSSSPQISSSSTNFTENPKTDRLLKFVLLGDTDVGKTAIKDRYLHLEDPTFFISDEHYKASQDTDFAIKYISMPNQANNDPTKTTSSSENVHYKLQIWDTPGSRRFHNLSTSYYKGIDGIFLVYDCTKPHTFNTVIESYWIELMKYAPANIKIVLIGNKCDLLSNIETACILDSKNYVSIVEGEEAGERLGIPFYAVSAKENVNIEKMFTAMIRRLTCIDNSSTPLSFTGDK